MRSQLGADVLLPSTTLNRKSNRIYSIAKVYASECERRPQQYWDYEQCCEIDWGTLTDYEIINKIGRGKYSEVFRGKHILNDVSCVIKVLKPVKLRKIHRELKILWNLTGGPNIVELLDVVHDEKTRVPAFIFEDVKNVDFRELYPTFKLSDVQYYFKQLLIALNYAHSMGIMPVSYTHLDVYKRQPYEEFFIFF